MLRVAITLCVNHIYLFEFIFPHILPDYVFHTCSMVAHLSQINNHPRNYLIPEPRYRVWQAVRGAGRAGLRPPGSGPAGGWSRNQPPGPTAYAGQIPRRRRRCPENCLEE